MSYDNKGTKPYCHWNKDHLLESAMGWSSRKGQLLCVPGGEELLSLWWDCHSNAGGTHGDARYGDWTHTTERRENVEVLVWHIPPPIHLLMPESTTSTGQHVRFTQPDQIPKAMTTLTPKDQAECHTHRRRPPNSSPHEICIFLTLDFYCSCGIQLHGIPVPSSKLNVGGEGYARWIC